MTLRIETLFIPLDRDGLWAYKRALCPDMKGSPAMNLRRAGQLLAGVGIVATIGCVSHQPFPDSSLSGTVLEVTIGESISSPAVTAKRGDEVRWINMSDTAVDIAVVQTREELISCQKGFASTNLGYLFGTSEYENIVMATVLPHQFASLCFAIPGKYVYTVRTDPSRKGSANKITGSLTIE